MSLRSIHASLLLGGLLMLGAAGAQADTTVRCESKGGSYKACSVDTRGGVRLSQQLSSNGCWKNDTWGYDRNRIWVDRGCRAEFRVGDGRSSSSSSSDAVAAAVVIGLVGAAVIASNNNDDHRHDNQYRDDDYYRDQGRYPDEYRHSGGYGDPRRVFSCESTRGRFVYCNVPTRGHVEIYKQKSSSSCTYGRSWGAEGNRIWVSDGCRADFAVY